MVQLGNKSIDSIYLGNKAVEGIYIGSKKVYPDSSEEDAVAVLVSEDGNTTKYFTSCTDAATYATENSDTNWNLTIRSGEVPYSSFDQLTNLISLKLEEGVTSIGDSAFVQCTGLTGDLIIPDSLTSIGTNAFMYCSGFTSLTLGKGLISVGQQAFMYCSGFTGDLVIPDSVQYLYTSAFAECTGFNGKLTISSNMIRIWEQVFANCKFVGSLVIPSTVTFVGSKAFRLCTEFDDDLSYYGKSNPTAHPWNEWLPEKYSPTEVFYDTAFTVCKVPVDYEDDEFLGLPVSKEL